MITRGRVLIVALAVLLLVVVLTVAASAWIVRSDAGSRQVLQWALALGAGTDNELVVQRIEGNLQDGLRLQDLRFTAADGSVELTLQRLEFAWQPWQLLQRRLSLDRLRIEGLRWRSRTATPAEPFDARVISDWFDALPLAIVVTQAELGDLQFQINDATFDVPELRFGAALEQGQLTLRDLSLLAFDVRVEGELVLQQDLGVQGMLDWTRDVDAAWAGALQVTGSLPQLELQHQLRLPLQLQSAGQVVTGLVAGETLRFALRHEAATLDLSPWDQPEISLTDLVLLTSGSPSNVAAELSLQAQYQGLAPAMLTANAVYTPESLTLQSAALRSDEVDLTLAGVLDLTSRALDLQWALARLDLERGGVNLAGVQGSGSAALVLQDGAVSGQLLVGPLRGLLNDQALALDGELQLQESAPQALALDLRSGDNLLQLQGELQPALEVAWTLEAPLLSQVYGPLGGQVAGAGELTGSIAAPLLTGALQGSELTFTQGDLQLALRDLQLDGSTGAGGNVLGVQFGGLLLQRAGETTTLVETATVTLEGSPAAHELTLLVNGMDSTVSLAATGALQEAAWQGQMQRAGIDSPFGAWALDAPVALAWQDGALQVAEHCWQGASPALCLALTGSAAEGIAGRLDLRQLPLAWLNRGDAAADKPVALQELQTAWGLDLPAGLVVQGSADLTANLAGLRAWPPAAAQAELRTRDVELQFTPQSEAGAETPADTQRYVVAAEPLRVVLADGVWRATTDLAITQVPDVAAEAGAAAFQGTLAADVTLDVDARLGGVVSLAFADLAFLESLVPGLQEPTGRLQGEATLAGSLSAPEIDADVAVSQGAFSLPVLGISVQDFGATLRSSTEVLSLRASGVSGEGELVLQASLLRPFAANREFSARLEGSDFTLLDTPDASATISPEVDLRFADNMLELQGSVALPSAVLDLESVVADVAEGGVDVSRDAVVLQPDPDALVAEQQRVLPFNAGLDLRLGDAVRVHGFGLDVALNGELRLTQEAERPLLAYGELGIPEGSYRIYNQELAVRDGRLLFYGNPLNPVLDVRAFRETPTAEVGMQISGTLGNIESRPYSTPTLPDNEILAMLVTGKSFNNMNDSDGNALLSAVANFGIERGEGITSMIGNKLGLDSVAINGGNSYLESSLGLGKYITPDLLMRYEIGIFDRQAVLTIDYSLTERLKLEVRSGISQSVDISYTIEKD